MYTLGVLQLFQNCTEIIDLKLDRIRTRGTPRVA